MSDIHRLTTTDLQNFISAASMSPFIAACIKPSDKSEQNLNNLMARTIVAHSDVDVKRSDAEKKRINQIKNLYGF